MTFVGYAMLLAGISAILYIGVKCARFGSVSLTNEDIQHIQAVAWLGAAILPAFINMIHAIGGGIDACLPNDFGAATRFSLFIGALTNGYYSIIGLRDKFSSMLNPPTNS